jgi:glycosyltransferase involved in cell wall biosynthesis
MRNRIIYLIPSKKLGGTEKMLALLANKISCYGFSPMIITMDKKGPFHDMLDQMAVPNYALNLKHKPLQGIFRLIAHFIAIKPVLIHSFLFWGNLLGKALSICTGTPLIMSQRSTDNWKKSFHWIVEYFPPSIPSAVISNSTAGIRALRTHTSLSSRRIYHIPNGISLDSFSFIQPDRGHYGFSQKEIIVGSIGNLRIAKGYKDFLYAAKIVLHHYPDIIFTIAGDGPERASLEELATTLSIQSKVRLPGFLSPVYNYLACFDIVVISSLWEGFPVAALEAMGMGKPIVATNVGDLSEIIEDGISGFLVPASNPEEIAKRIMQLIKDPSLAGSMGKAARARVEKHYQLKNMIAAHSALYQKILKKRKNSLTTMYNASCV